MSNDNYYIYLDYKSNKDNNRLPKLKEILNYVSEGSVPCKPRSFRYSKMLSRSLRFRHFES